MRDLVTPNMCLDASSSSAINERSERFEATPADPSPLTGRRRQSAAEDGSPLRIETTSTPVQSLQSEDSARMREYKEEHQQ